MTAQALIIGAGPGGSAAAIRLAQRGIENVVLVDKDNFPRDKTCGSALSPNAIAVLGELGVGDQVHQLGYPIRSLVLKTPGEREMHVTTEQAAIILLRKHFDQLLVDQARRLGVTFRDGVRLGSLIQEGGRVVGAAGKQGEIRARYVLCADGAHSIFSIDPRPKRTISTLMGWWEQFPFEPATLEMIFDRNLAPLYGWMFPETPERVNIGICIDGEEADGTKQSRNVREVFDRFLDDHFRQRLRGARQLGRFKGHPISYTTWIRELAAPGALYLGEAARMTHLATGEGIYQAMQSGIYAADAIADALEGAASEAQAWRGYGWRCRKRFTVGFLVGHLFRGLVRTPLLDAVSIAYNDARVRRLATWAIGSALAGSQVSSAEPLSLAPGAAPAPLAVRSRN